MMIMTRNLMMTMTRNHDNDHDREPDNDHNEEPDDLQHEDCEVAISVSPPPLSARAPFHFILTNIIVAIIINNITMGG